MDNQVTSSLAIIITKQGGYHHVHKSFISWFGFEIIGKYYKKTTYEGGTIIFDIFHSPKKTKNLWKEKEKK